jgi:hypothetical protein
VKEWERGTFPRDDAHSAGSYLGCENLSSSEVEPTDVRPLICLLTCAVRIGNGSGRVEGNFSFISFDVIGTGVPNVLHVELDWLSL